MGNHSQPQIRISVRNLVEFVMRSGDLDNRRTAGAKKEAMQAGSRLHRKIQKRMGSAYRSEVMLEASGYGRTCLRSWWREGRTESLPSRAGSHH